MFYFQIFRGRLNQLSGVWHTVGPRDLAECRGADTVCQQQRYELSHTNVRQFGIKCSVHRYIKSGAFAGLLILQQYCFYLQQYIR